jgi:hypothetical protein
MFKSKFLAHVTKARVEIGRAFIIENPGKRCARSHQRRFAKLAAALRREQFKDALLAALGGDVPGDQKSTPGLFHHGVMLGLLCHKACSLN